MVPEGVGQSDVSVVPVGAPAADLVLVTTTDFFYPLVDDPYVMGRIGCCNVLSDLYAAGVTHCDSLLMLLAECTEIPDTAGLRGCVTQLLMRGFADAARDVGVAVTGGQSVRGAWPLIGGAASAVCPRTQLLAPGRAIPGDVVVLTKPLGMQVCVNAHQWLARRATSPVFRARAEQLDALLPAGVVEASYRTAARQMARMNRRAAELMHVHGAHAATDVTGFGILGHAANLAQEQGQSQGKEQGPSVALEIHTLPILRGMVRVLDVVNFPLLQGRSAETSGGLLVCLPSEAAARAYCAELERDEGFPAWIVGRVVERDPATDTPPAYIVEKPTIIEY